MARAAQKTRPAAEWAKIRAAYIAGEGSYRELAERFGVSEVTVEKHAAREGWREKRRKADGKTDEKVIAQVSDLRARLHNARWSFAEKLLAKAEKSLDDVETYDPDGMSALARAVNSACPADAVSLDTDTGSIDETTVVVIRRRGQAAPQPEA